MKNRWIACGAVLCASSFFVGHAVAQDGGDKPGGGFPMPAWMQKTKEHESFKRLEGSWKVVSKFWMMPGADPTVSEGEGVVELLYDGKVVHQTYKGSMMGTPFTGQLFMGFDTIDKEFVSVWMDSMSPIISISRGKERDGVINFEGKEANPMTGKKEKSLMSVKWINDDQYKVTFHKVTEEGKKVLGGEMTYTRKK